MDRKKILIVSYYWPPAGGPGVQRWLKFTKYLPDYGYDPYVYTPKNPSYPIIDISLVNDISPKVKVAKKRIWEPYKFAERLNKKNKDYKAGQFEPRQSQSFLSRLSVYIRGNYFIPDARKFWIKPSVKFLNKYLIDNNIDIIVTSGPPHSMHLIGLNLKKIQPKLKWIADFRDPWTQISYYSQLKLTLSSDLKHKKLEKEVLQTADLVLSTSYTDRENFKNLGAKKVFCITNGFDSELNDDFLRIRKEKSLKFIISYIGMLETLRNPNNLWKALNILIKQHPNFRKDLQVNFVGKISEDIIEAIYKTPLKSNIQNKGYLSHELAIEEMRNSEILILTNFSEEKFKGIIPGKLFEYISISKPILSIGPKDADVDIILKKTNLGKHFSHDDKDIENIKFFILSTYEKWKHNIINPIDSDSIKKFHRKELTKTLSEVLAL